MVVTNVFCLVLLAFCHIMEGKVTQDVRVEKRGVLQDEVTPLKDTLMLGCYDNKPNDRIFSHSFKNFRRLKGLWSMYPNFTEVSELCADAAKRYGFQYFGIEYYAECWSGKVDGEWKFEKHGKSDNCIGRVGKRDSVMVYKFDGCYFNGQYYENHAEMPTTGYTDPCVTRCKCADGERRCYAKQCPSVDTMLCEKTKKDSDNCCTICGCEHNDVIMEEGSSWKKMLDGGTCSKCVCENGEAKCAWHITGCTEPTARPTMPPTQPPLTFPDFEFP